MLHIVSGAIVQATTNFGTDVHLFSRDDGIDNGTDVFTVDGSVTTPGAPAGSGRVRAVLSPRNAASAPAAPAASPAPLRSTTTLGGERK